MFHWYSNKELLQLLIFSSSLSTLIFPWVVTLQRPGVIVMTQIFFFFKYSLGMVRMNFQLDRI